MKKYLMIMLLLALAVSACNAKENGSSASLIGTWKLTSYGPATSPTPAIPDAGGQVSFNDDGTVTGNSGCNGLGGGYKVDGDKITFDQITSTLMACDDARMAQEDVVLKVLTDTASFQIEGNALTLTNNGNVLVFNR